MAENNEQEVSLLLHHTGIDYYCHNRARLYRSFPITMSSTSERGNTSRVNRRKGETELGDRSPQNLYKPAEAKLMRCVISSWERETAAQRRL